MNIRDIKTYRLEVALTEPFAYSQGWYERRGAMLVELKQPIEQKNGWVEIPVGPGLGVEIDRGAIDKFRID